jgi:hypothetical protein
MKHIMHNKYIQNIISMTCRIITSNIHNIKTDFDNF